MSLLEEFETLVWSRSIGDVRLDDPEHYGSDVKAWAQGVLADTAGLMQKLNQ